MGNKDNIVLRKILKHVTSIISYCEKYSALNEFEADSMCVVNLM